MNKLQINNKQELFLSGWKKTKLNNLIMESRERNSLKKLLPVFSITNKEGFILQSYFFSHNIHSKDTSNYKIFRKNYFGYNPARINVGSIALYEGEKEGLLSPMYVVFKTNSTLFPKYLKYCIQTKIFKNQVINNVVGSVRESLKYSALETFDLFFPESIVEQIKVAEILENIDETIEKTDKIINKYKRIKEGLMQDLFTKGITAFQFEKNKLIQAVTEAYKKGDHKFRREENLVGHLKDYLCEQFPKWNIDGEVEKNNQTKRPDIIIHKRGTKENLFAIEVKKNSNLNVIKEDIKKLEDVMLGDYHYKDAVFIGFDVENKNEIFALSDKINFILVSKNGEIKTKSLVRKLKDSPIGKIPEEWEIVSLNQVFRLRSGDVKPPDTSKFGRYPVYGGNGILGFSDEYNFNKESLIIGRVGEHCGAISISNKGWITDNALYTVCKKKNYDNLFLYYLLNFINLNQFSAETGQPLMTQSIVYQMTIVYPINKEQNYIKIILLDADKTIEKEINYKQKLERIKQGLMEDLLKGKVRVNHLIEEGNQSV